MTLKPVLLCMFGSVVAPCEDAQVHCALGFSDTRAAGFEADRQQCLNMLTPTYIQPPSNGGTGRDNDGMEGGVLGTGRTSTARVTVQMVGLQCPSLDLSRCGAGLHGPSVAN
ncbi:MAG: hypothetical protein AB3N23_05720 [Paracoccaceae bacterium]